MENKWNGLERYTLEWYDYNIKSLKDKMEFTEWEDVDGIAIIQQLKEISDSIIREAYSSVSRMMKDLIMLGLYPNNECTKYYIADVSHAYDLVSRSLSLDEMYENEHIDESIRRKVIENWQMLYESAIDKVKKIVGDEDLKKIPKMAPWTLEDLHQKNYLDLVDQITSKLKY